MGINMKKMSVMTKIGLITGGSYLFLLLLILLFVCMMGGAGGTGTPVPATEEQAYDYQYVCAEIGAPWDVVLLADIFLSAESGETSEIKPIFTALQFGIVTERRLARHMVETDELTPEGEVKWETQWRETEVNSYYGLEEILSYMKLEGSWLADKNMAAVIKKINEICEEKEAEEEGNDIKYEALINVNQDTEGVLMNFIGLTQEQCSNVMSLHQAQYLAQLYSYAYSFDETLLPELVVGEICRSELAQVAVSLIGHPYLLGGKSPEAGPPKGPLDCSGFVDWVYIQCFGTGVSSGGIPEGVAVSGTALQWYASVPIPEAELKVGDLAFLYDPARLAAGKINHVGIFIGEADGVNYFIHCAGKSYGTKDQPSGRVGISKRTGGSNAYNCVTGGSFEPAMKSCNFRYFRRPNFSFTDDFTDGEKEG